MFLTRSRLQRVLDPERVVAAIREAEAACSAEIRVSVSGALWGDPRKRAEKAFARLGMAKTERRNGVLIHLMLHRRRFTVLGDSGINAAVGQTFWDATAAAMGERFKSGDFTGGLEHGIAEVGRQLAKHFPSEAGGNPNELPDQVDIGG
jgi:putative membrane protein